MPCRASGSLCPVLGVATDARHLEGMRSKLKKPVTRSVWPSRRLACQPRHGEGSTPSSAIDEVPRN